MGFAVINAPVTSIRLYHLTFYKAGSQWVRDILADPRLVAYSGHSVAASGIDLQAAPWPALTRGEIGSPLYSTGAHHWRQFASPSDRAFVVIRDPRDIVVSLVYSVSCSHAPNPITDLLRAPLAAASPAHRIQTGMYLLAQWADPYRTWKDYAEFDNVCFTRYESLITDLAGELTRLFAFLDWRVPAKVTQEIARDNAFELRSGRKPGEENQFSHRRKGIAGDWRNHFDRQLGQLFETAFPGMLSDLGYEFSNDWWQDLPESVQPPLPAAEQQRLQLLSVLEEHESELALIRQAAEERLRDVHILHDALAVQNAVAEERLCHIVSLHSALAEQTGTAEERLRAIERMDRQLRAVRDQLQLAQSAADDRLAQILSLSAEIVKLQSNVAILEQTAASRLADIEAREATRVQLEQSISWRYGFRTVRALTSAIRL